MCSMATRDAESTDGTATGIMSAKQKELFEARHREERKALRLWFYDEVRLLKYYALLVENGIEDLQTAGELVFQALI